MAFFTLIGTPQVRFRNYTDTQKPKQPLEAVTEQPTLEKVDPDKEE